MRKILSCLLLALIVGVLLLMVVSAGAQTTRIKLTQIEKSNTVNGTKADQIPLSNGVGDLRYAQYVEINPTTIGYTPATTGNPAANYSQFVKPANGDIWYIDNNGRGVKLYVAASAGDYDWLEIGNNQIPNSITDSIYKYKYAAVGGRIVWPTAEMIVIDSVAQGMFIVAGLRKAKIALYDTENQTWSTMEQGGGSTAIVMQSGGTFFIQTAGIGSPQAPGSPIVDHFIINPDSSIQFPQYKSTRTDAGTPTVLFGPDATGKMKNYAVSTINNGVFTSGPVTGSGTSLLPLNILSNSIDSQYIKARGIAGSDIALNTIANGNLVGGILLSKLGQSGAATNQVPQWNGSTWVPATVSGGGSSLPNVIGEIYNALTFTNIDTFNNIGATASVTSGKINISGGANNYLQSLDLKKTHTLERWLIESRVIPTENTATSYGWGFGVNSTNTTSSFNYDMIAYFDNSTGANKGKVSLISQTNSTPTTVATSSTALTYSIGDTLLFSVQRDQEKFKVTLYNVTTKTSNVTVEYYYKYATNSTIIAGTGRWSIFSVGGTFSVLNFKVSSSEQKGGTICVGDSKTAGYGAGELPQRWAELIKASNGNAVILGGGGDKTTETLSAIANHIGWIQPKYAILSIGSNDVRLGVSLSTIQSNYSAIVTALTAGGSTVYHAPFYESSAPITALYSWILSTYTTNVFGTYENAGSLYLSADGVHPNVNGNARISQVVSLKMPIQNGLPVSQTISGQLPSGGLIPFSSSGNRVTYDDFLRWDATTQRLGVKNNSNPPAYTLDVGGTASVVNAPLFRSSTSTGNVQFGGFASLFNNTVQVEQLNGINFNNTAVIGTGQTTTSELQIRALSSGGIIRIQDRSGKSIFLMTTAGSQSNTSITGGYAYAGASNFAGSNFPICAGLGSGTGTPGDLIFATGTQVASGTNDQTVTNRVWIKGQTGLMGIFTSNPAYSLDINATDGVRITTGTTAQRGTAAAGVIRHNTDLNKFEGSGSGATYYPFDQTLLSATTNTTVTNTTVVSTLATVSIPANSLAAGQTLRIMVEGFIQTDATTPGNLRVGVVYGTDTLYSAVGGLRPIAGGSAKTFTANFSVRISAAGASGTMRVQGFAQQQTDSTDPQFFGGWYPFSNPKLSDNTGVNTTTAKNLALFGQFGTALATNGISITNATIIRQ
jgi:hypothetical protein